MKKQGFLWMVLSVCLLIACLMSQKALAATDIDKKPALSVYVGTTRNLNAGEGMRGKRTWTSTKPKVVSVDEHGIIRALKAGKATIKVSNGKITRTCEVTVKAAKLSKKKVTTRVGKKVTLQLKCGRKKGITWKSSDPSILEPTSTEGKKSVWKAKKAGTVTVTATFMGKKLKATVKVKPEKVPEAPVGPDTVMPEI